VAKKLHLIHALKKARSFAVLKNVSEQADVSGKRKIMLLTNPTAKNVLIIKRSGERNILLVIIRNYTVRITPIM
jgi:hypothetical protein